MSRPRILAVHSGALGDCVLFGHLLTRLEGEVTLVAGGEKARLLAGLGVVTRAIDFDSLPMQELFSDTPLTQCTLPHRLGEHDRLVSCFAGGDLRAEQRLAAMCSSEAAAFLPIRPPAESEAHLLDLWSDLLGLPPKSHERYSPWPLPPAWKAAAGEAGAYTVIHPGAGGAEKCWPLENFLRLAERLERAVFVLGPVELDRWRPQDIKNVRERFPTRVCPSLETLAGVLAEASGFVGNDSGCAHLAAALGRPTVVLFGPTRPEHFKPIGRSVRIVHYPSLEKRAVADAYEALQSLRANAASSI